MQSGISFWSEVALDLKLGFGMFKMCGFGHRALPH